MRKATRLLLGLRAKAKHVTVTSVELEGAKPNQYYQNTFEFVGNHDNLFVVTGWLVGEFLGENGTAIIPHYWVLNNKIGQYLDPTPMDLDDEQTYEYVVDFEIFEFGSKDSILPVPLRLLANGKIQARLSESQSKNLEKIDIAELFELTKSI